MTSEGCSDVVIRPALLDDSERIAALIADLAVKYIVHDFSPEGRARFLADHTPESISKRIQTGFDYHLALSTAGLVGVVGIRDFSHLYHLFVSDSLHRRGLGKRLWQHAKAICLAKGNPGVFTVNSSRHAVGMYERLGFVATAPVQDVSGIQFVPMQLVEAKVDMPQATR